LKVKTIEDLRLITGSIKKNVACVSGYYSDGDLAGGPLRYWDEISRENDNGGNVIRPVTVKQNSPGRWIWREVGEVYADWWGGNIQAAINSGYKKIILKEGVTYKLSQTLMMAPNIILGSDGSYDQAGLNFSGLSKIVLAKNFIGDAISFSKNDSSSELKGIFIDCTNQVQGDGISFKTEKEVRNMNKINNVVVYKATRYGIFNSVGYKGNIYKNLYIKSSGSHGIYSQSVDSLFDFVWLDGNGGSGIYLPRSKDGNAGGNRYSNVDSWGNLEHGIVEEQSGDTWIRLQCDLNGKSGIILQNKANSNIFIGLKLLSGRGENIAKYSSITFDDGDSGSPFGNIFNNINASDELGYFSYLIEDKSKKPSVNIIENITASFYSKSEKPFSFGLFNDGLIKNSIVKNIIYIPSTGGIRPIIFDNIN
jgi:hypothetical protein